MNTAVGFRGKSRQKLPNLVKVLVTGGRGKTGDHGKVVFVSGEKGSRIKEIIPRKQKFLGGKLGYLLHMTLSFLPLWRKGKHPRIMRSDSIEFVGQSLRFCGW